MCAIAGPISTAGVAVGTRGRGGRTRGVPDAYRVGLLLALLGSTPAPAVSAGDGAGAGDLLLVTLDTTRADRLGVYDPSLATTPELQRLAGESVVFERAHAQAAVTPVSHASILTGLDPYHHGLRVLHGLVANRLPEAVVTLAEVWRRHGGRSAAFVSAFPAGPEFGLDQGFDAFDADFLARAGGSPVSPNGDVNTGLAQRRADETTELAVRWLAEVGESQQPLLLWVHYFDPHDPLLLPPAAVGRRFPAASRSRPDVLRAIYDAEIYFVDSQLGRLLAAFRARRSWARATVAVVADHGEGLGDHDWWSHGVLYEEQIHVPWLLKGPGLPAGGRVAAPVRTIDLMPTVLELAGVPPGLWPAMDGVSLVSEIVAGREAPPRLSYADSVNILEYGRPDRAADVDRKRDKLYSLSDGRYKLIYHQLAPAESELYDLLEDPRELHDLAPSRPAPLASLRRRLLALGALSDLLPGMTATDLERLRKLRSLGYVD